MRSFYLITYDVPGDKRRLKVAKQLEALGERVQYSVFEAWLSAKELKALLQRLEKVLEPKQDSLRVYTLCEACRSKARIIGLGKASPPPGVVIV